MNSHQNVRFISVLAALGLACGLSGMSWIVGTFGVSGVTAQAIVKAVEGRQLGHVLGRHRCNRWPRRRRSLGRY